MKARVDIGTGDHRPVGSSPHPTARARAGDVRVLGAESNGWEVERVGLSPGSQATLVVDAAVGAGSVRIDRAVR